MVDLNEKIIKACLEQTAKHDSRAVKPDLENDFLNGRLSEFRKFVSKHKKDKLAVLLRGNGGKIVIYYNNHAIWELSLTGKKVKVSFNFDHARYSEDWSAKLDKLTGLFKKDEASGFVLARKSDKNISTQDNRIQITYNKKNQPNGGSIGMISCTAESFSEAFVKESFEIFTGFVKSFFDDQRVDYFKKKVAEDPDGKFDYLRSTIQNGRGKGPGLLLEKRWQHKLFFELKDTKNGYYVYDLEFSQPYPDQNDIKKAAKATGYDLSGLTASQIKQKISVNEPDMLAIRFEDSVPKALVLIEVKCTYSACASKESGIIKHLEGMKEYSQKCIYAKKRKDDAEKCLKQYQELGFFPENVAIPDLSKLPIERVLILTSENMSAEEKSVDGAIKYYLTHQKSMDAALKKTDTKLMCTYSSYCSPKVEWK